MKYNFDKSLKFVLKHEGGFVNHPKDPGGATNKGVTLYTYRRYVNRNAKVEDLKNIDDDTLAYIYKKYYWDAVKGDDIPSGIDYAMFDFAVNSGPRRAILFAQDILGVKSDGIFGPKTLAAINSVNVEQFIKKLCDNRLAWLKRLPHWNAFGRGWTRRVNEVRSEAQKMAKAVKQKPTQPAQKTEKSDPVEPVRPSLFAALIAFLKAIFVRKND